MIAGLLLEFADIIFDALNLNEYMRLARYHKEDAQNIELDEEAKRNIAFLGVGMQVIIYNTSPFPPHTIIYISTLYYDYLNIIYVLILVRNKN